jgi:chromosome segregation ATPase
MFDEQENQPVIQHGPEVEQIEENTQSTEKNPKESFRELRQKMDRIQRERDEALNYIKNIEAKTNNNVPDNSNDDEDFNLDPDALAEGKHISKVAKKIKNLEQKLKSFQQQSTETATEARLKAKYQDFDKVVSKDNVEALRDSHPELWETINSAPDLYNRAVTAYTMIKELRLSPDDSFDAAKIAVQKNSAKPRPLNSVSPQQGDSPLSRANAFEAGLTDELRDQLRKEMELARRNR